MRGSAWNSDSIRAGIAEEEIQNSETRAFDPKSI